MHDLVVAMTGASGAIYAIRLLEVLLVAGHTVHLTISKSAAIVLDRELGMHVDLRNSTLAIAARRIGAGRRQRLADA